MVERVERDRVGEAIRRLVAGIFALSWFVVPGFGLIDLWVIVAGDPSWPIMLEAGWGLYMTLFVGLPFAMIAVRGRSRTLPAVAVLYVAAGAGAVSAVISLEVPALFLAGAIALETVIVTGSPRNQLAEVTLGRPARTLLIAAALGAIPALAYAWTMWGLNRANLPDRDITSGVDHFSMQGALALAVLALVTFAAIWPAGRLFLGVIAGVAVAILGLASWFWHPAGGSFGPPWSAACIVWGMAVVAISIMTRLRAAVVGSAPAAPVVQP